MAVCPEFAIAACATKCVSKETILRCEKGDPDCVCADSAASDSEVGAMTKCIVDSCSIQDAAIAFATFIVDCGIVASLWRSRNRYESTNTNLWHHLCLA
jgi:hypothetical protein